MADGGRKDPAELSGEHLSHGNVAEAGGRTWHRSHVPTPLALFVFRSVGVVWAGGTHKISVLLCDLPFHFETILNE